MRDKTEKAVGIVQVGHFPDSQKIHSLLFSLVRCVLRDLLSQAPFPTPFLVRLTVGGAGGKTIRQEEKLGYCSPSPASDGLHTGGFSSLQAALSVVLAPASMP